MDRADRTWIKRGKNTKCQENIESSPSSHDKMGGSDSHRFREHRRQMRADEEVRRCARDEKGTSQSMSSDSGEMMVDIEIDGQPSTSPSPLASSLTCLSTSSTYPPSLPTLSLSKENSRDSESEDLEYYRVNIVGTDQQRTRWRKLCCEAQEQRSRWSAGKNEELNQDDCSVSYHVHNHSRPLASLDAKKIPCQRTIFGDIHPLVVPLGEKRKDEISELFSCHFRTRAIQQTWSSFYREVEGRILRGAMERGMDGVCQFVSFHACSLFAELPTLVALAGLNVADHSYAFRLTAEMCQQRVRDSRVAVLSARECTSVGAAFGHIYRQFTSSPVAPVLSSSSSSFPPSLIKHTKASVSSPTTPATNTGRITTTTARTTTTRARTTTTTGCTATTTASATTITQGTTTTTASTTQNTSIPGVVSSSSTFFSPSAGSFSPSSDVRGFDGTDLGQPVSEDGSSRKCEGIQDWSVTMKSMTEGDRLGDDGGIPSLAMESDEMLGPGSKKKIEIDAVSELCRWYSIELEKQENHIPGGGGSRRQIPEEFLRDMRDKNAPFLRPVRRSTRLSASSSTLTSSISSPVSSSTLPSSSLFPGSSCFPDLTDLQDKNETTIPVATARPLKRKSTAAFPLVVMLEDTESLSPNVLSGILDVGSHLRSEKKLPIVFILGLSVNPRILESICDPETCRKLQVEALRLFDTQKVLEELIHHILFDPFTLPIAFPPSLVLQILNQFNTYHGCIATVIKSIYAVLSSFYDSSFLSALSRPVWDLASPFPTPISSSSSSPSSTSFSSSYARARDVRHITSDFSPLAIERKSRLILKAGQFGEKAFLKKVMQRVKTKVNHLYYDFIKSLESCQMTSVSPMSSAQNRANRQSADEITDQSSQGQQLDNHIEDQASGGARLRKSQKNTEASNYEPAILKYLRSVKLQIMKEGTNYSFFNVNDRRDLIEHFLPISVIEVIERRFALSIALHLLDLIWRKVNKIPLQERLGALASLLSTNDDNDGIKNDKVRTRQRERIFKRRRKIVLSAIEDVGRERCRVLLELLDSFASAAAPSFAVLQLLEMHLQQYHHQTNDSPAYSNLVNELQGLRIELGEFCETLGQGSDAPTRMDDDIGLLWRERLIDFCFTFLNHSLCPSLFEHPLSSQLGAPSDNPSVLDEVNAELSSHILCDIFRKNDTESDIQSEGNDKNHKTDCDESRAHDNCTDTSLHCVDHEGKSESIRQSSGQRLCEARPDSGIRHRSPSNKGSWKSFSRNTKATALLTGQFTKGFSPGFSTTDPSLDRVDAAKFLVPNRSDVSILLRLLQNSGRNIQLWDWFCAFCDHLLLSRAVETIDSSLSSPSSSSFSVSSSICKINKKIIEALNASFSYLDHLTNQLRLVLDSSSHEDGSLVPLSAPSWPLRPLHIMSSKTSGDKSSNAVPGNSCTTKSDTQHQNHLRGADKSVSPTTEYSDAGAVIALQGLYVRFGIAVATLSGFLGLVRSPSASSSSVTMWGSFNACGGSNCESGVGISGDVRVRLSGASEQQGSNYARKENGKIREILFGDTATRDHKTHSDSIAGDVSDFVACKSLKAFEMIDGGEVECVRQLRQATERFWTKRLWWGGHCCMT